MLAKLFNNNRRYFVYNHVFSGCPRWVQWVLYAGNVLSAL